MDLAFASLDRERVRGDARGEARPARRGAEAQGKRSIGRESGAVGVPEPVDAGGPGAEKCVLDLVKAKIGRSRWAGRAWPRRTSPSTRAPSPCRSTSAGRRSRWRRPAPTRGSAGRASRGASWPPSTSAGRARRYRGGVAVPSEKGRVRGGLHGRGGAQGPVLGAPKPGRAMFQIRHVGVAVEALRIDLPQVVLVCGLPMEAASAHSLVAEILADPDGERCARRAPPPRGAPAARGRGAAGAARRGLRGRAAGARGPVAHRGRRPLVGRGGRRQARRQGAAGGHRSLPVGRRRAGAAHPALPGQRQSTGPLARLPGAGGLSR